MSSNEWILLAVLALALMAVALWLSRGLRHRPLLPRTVHKLTTSLKLSDTPEELRRGMDSLLCPAPNSLLLVKEIEFATDLTKAHAEIMEALSRKYEYLVLDPASYIGMDLEQLDEMTRQFESLGFARKVDLALTWQGQSEPQAFSRTLLHTNLKCTAELQSCRGLGGGVIIGTVGSSMRDNWSLFTTSRNATWMDYLYRHPQLLRVFMPTASPDQLLKHHLKRRSEVVKRFDLHLEDPVQESLDELSDRAALGNKMHREIWEKIDLKTELSQAIREFPGGTWEWLGKE